MASDLLSIASSGAKAARTALDVTAQNIANASTDGYIRRSVSLEEVSAAGGIGQTGDISLSGVRLDRIVRNADLFRQAEVRRTGADAARANAEVSALENIESAVEQSNVFSTIATFESRGRRSGATGFATRDRRRPQHLVAPRKAIVRTSNCDLERRVTRE